jgi:hypothetical protein
LLVNSDYYYIFIKNHSKFLIDLSVRFETLITPCEQHGNNQNKFFIRKI